MSKFDYATHFDFIVHKKHHLLSYTVQRILLQLVTGADAPVDTLIQSAKIFFHYRFIPWECVQVDNKIGLIVPYQQENCQDLIVGKADIKYIEDVYTLMWYPYLVLFLDDIELKDVTGIKMVELIESLADFNIYESVVQLYKKCILVPRLFIERHSALEVTDEKIKELLRLYSRTEDCLKLTHQSAEYYNLYMSPEFIIGHIRTDIKELYQGTLLPNDNPYTNYLSTLNHRHSKVPSFEELSHVTWTKEYASGLKPIAFRPSPKRLGDALREEMAVPDIIDYEPYLEAYFFLSLNSEYIGLYPFRFGEFVFSMENKSMLTEHIFLSLLHLVRFTTDKDKFPIPNSQKYMETDKATAMIIEDGNIKPENLKRAKAITEFKLAEKKFFKYLKYYKPTTWIFCFAIFLREFVDLEQIPDLLIILEHLLDIKPPTTMQVDGAVDISEDDNDSLDDSKRTVTRSMDLDQLSQTRRSSRSTSSNDQPSSKRKKLNDEISEESKFVTSSNNNLDDNEIFAEIMITRFHKLQPNQKLSMILYMISIVTVSREFSIFVDKSVELKSNADDFIFKTKNLVRGREEICKNIEKQILQRSSTKLSLINEQSTADEGLEKLQRDLDDTQKDIIDIKKKLRENEQTSIFKTNSRIEPLGSDRFQNRYYFIDMIGPVSDIEFGLGMILVKGSGNGSEIFGQEGKIPGSDISHYCYSKNFPEEYTLDIPKGMDDGKMSKNWFVYSTIEEIDLLLDWLYDSIPLELFLKQQLNLNLPNIKSKLDKRLNVIINNLESKETHGKCLLYQSVV
eukprot:NODE_173_length_14219_cov_0.603824.p2 type:complete len:793 gc:universal NODE_173_length_14219_cov_0.603824:6544-8922(+)